jgi:hypothetical protein
MPVYPPSALSCSALARSASEGAPPVLPAGLLLCESRGLSCTTNVNTAAHDVELRRAASKVAVLKHLHKHAQAYLELLLELDGRLEEAVLVGCGARGRGGVMGREGVLFIHSSAWYLGCQARRP